MIEKAKAKFLRDRVHSTRREVMFSVCPYFGGGVYGSPSPSPSHNTSTGPMSFLRRYPISIHNISSGPMSFSGGTPVTGPRSGWWGVTHDGSTSPVQVWGSHPARSGWGYPHSGMGVPPGQGSGTPPPPPAFTQEDFLVLRCFRQLVWMLHWFCWRTTFSDVIFSIRKCLMWTKPKCSFTAIKGESKKRQKKRWQISKKSFAIAFTFTRYVSTISHSHAFNVNTSDTYALVYLKWKQLSGGQCSISLV